MKRLFIPVIALIAFLAALTLVPQQQARGQSAGLVSSYRWRNGTRVSGKTINIMAP